MNDASTSEPPDEGGDEPRSGEPLRPIPDGGLRAAMPDWLRQSPSWRSRSEESVDPPPRTVVEDTSTIDPRTILDIDDLPPWLQAIAARNAEGECADRPVPDIVESPSTSVALAQPALGPADIPPDTHQAVEPQPLDDARHRRMDDVAAGLDTKLVPALLILILLVGLILLGIWLVEAV